MGSGSIPTSAVRPVALLPVLLFVLVSRLEPCRLCGDLVLTLGGASLGSGGSTLSLLLVPVGGALGGSIGGGAGLFGARLGGSLLGRQQLLHYILEVGTLHNRIAPAE